MLVLPILVPLSTAAVLMLTPKRPAPQRWISLAGSVLLLASALLVFLRVNTAGVQVLQISGWPAPFGITLVADLLAAVLVVAVGVVGTAISVVAFSGVDPRREAFGYHPLMQILLMGVAGAFLTGDFFNLYVWFEVMLVASFVLMALNRTRAQMEAAFKYVTINLIASSIFLTALGLLYGATGTLNMAELARVWPTISTPGVDTVLAVLFLIAFSIKAGLFPLFFWLPASYHTPPAAIGAAFAGLLTKVGVYALIRVFTLLFHSAPPALFTLLLAMSAATMVIGLVAALNERDFRRVLSFNLVGHIGYTTASLSLLTPAALAGAIFYVLHHIVVITNLYLVSGVLLRLRRTTDMARLGGLYRDQPLFSALAMMPDLLAGRCAAVVRLSRQARDPRGHVRRRRLLGRRTRARGRAAHAAVDGAAPGQTRFWRPAAEAPDLATPGTPLLVAIAALSLLTVAMTIGAEPLFELASRGAQQLLQRDEYVRAVLGGPR